MKESQSMERISMGWIPPMEPILTDRLIEGDAFTHQIKWDGIRGLVYLQQGETRIFTKSGRERTAYYPEINQIAACFNGEQAVLDGELVVLGEDSRPAFERSLIRERVGNLERVAYYVREHPVVYILFDILSLNGCKLTHLPLIERKRILNDHIHPIENIAVTDDYPQASELWQLMRQKNWEGIVSKRKDSPYIPGKKHDFWYKRKIQKRVLAVVCGIQWRDAFPNALILGVYKQKKLRYIGKASIGLTQKDLLVLKEHTQQLIVLKNPFPENIFMERITWLEPRLTCWAGFMEWTTDKVMRHPKILGFSSQSPHEVDGKEWISDG